MASGIKGSGMSKLIFSTARDVTDGGRKRSSGSGLGLTCACCTVCLGGEDDIPVEIGTKVLMVSIFAIIVLRPGKVEHPSKI